MKKKLYLICEFTVITIMRDYDEVKASTYREGRIDFPQLGYQILRRFKLMNTPNWEKLKVVSSSFFFSLNFIKFKK